MATKCKLQVRYVSVALDAAWGQVYPSGIGALVHGANLAPGFAKVNVDGVCANFEAVPLKIPPNDEVMTLGQAVGTFIQWPKEDICLELPAPVSTSRECPATASSPRDLTAPKLPALTRQGPAASHASTPRAQSTLVKSTYTKRGSKGKGKSKTIESSHDIPFLPLARKYKPGEPLLEKLDSPTLGLDCTELHAWYMEQSNKPVDQRCSGVTVKFKEHHFNHVYQDAVFTVTFDDLFCLFNLDELDVSIIRCWTL